MQDKLFVGKRSQVGNGFNEFGANMERDITGERLSCPTVRIYWRT